MPLVEFQMALTAAVTAPAPAMVVAAFLIDEPTPAKVPAPVIGARTRGILVSTPTPVITEEPAKFAVPVAANVPVPAEAVRTRGLPTRVPAPVKDEEKPLGIPFSVPTWLVTFENVP